MTTTSVDGWGMAHSTKRGEDTMCICVIGRGWDMLEQSVARRVTLTSSHNGIPLLGKVTKATIARILELGTSAISP